MSIEIPEAYILQNQMLDVLVGKTVSDCEMQDYEKAQKTGFINQNIDDFQRLIGKEIEKVEIKGSSVIIRLHDAMNLMIAPEYGGKYFYHENTSEIPKKWHMKISCILSTFMPKAIKTGKPLSMPFKKSLSLCRSGVQAAIPAMMVTTMRVLRSGWISLTEIIRRI